MRPSSRARFAVVFTIALACDAQPPAKPDATVVAKASDGKAPAGERAKAVTPPPKADAPTTAVAPPPPGAEAQAWSFDAAAVGTVPPGFAPEQTGEQVEPHATWAVVADADAPSPPHAFGVTKTVGVNKTFNLALIEGTALGDFELSVMLRAVSGTNNQGGGVVFRAKGGNDHYVARWNPVENNFRIYAMLGGARVDLAAAPLELDAKAWHHLRVVVSGDHIECFVDDKPVAHATDRALPEAGMIGLWTKGDAATLFDDLTVGPVD